MFGSSTFQEGGARYSTVQEQTHQQGREVKECSEKKRIEEKEKE